MDKLVSRLHIRLARTDDTNSELLKEYVKTAVDRILLRVGEDTLHETLESVAVEVAVKLYRRQYHEGISSENVDSLSTSFVDNVLDEYDAELSAYKAKRGKASKLGVVRFI